jgi:membrane-bound lytic murein transglycosylase F
MMRVIWDSKRNWTIVFLLLVIALMLFAQRATPPGDEPDVIQPVDIDLEEIINRDTLRAITGNNSLSYFVYKGNPMGYEYELLTRFASHIDVQLDLIVAEDREEYFDLLNSGKIDIVADNLAITRERQMLVDFTDHHNTVRQVLVQRKPEKWWQYTRDQLDRRLIRNPIDLIGKKVHIRKNSSFDTRLQNLSDEIGGNILMEYHDGRRSVEELINMVSNGQIDYTIADDHIAMINSTYLKNIDIGTDISYPQRIAWAVRHGSPDLKTAINDWMANMKRTGDYQVIYNKYFRNSKAYSRRLDSDYFSATGGSVSYYDDIIKQYAEELGWDWRLLAAQIYVESNFDNSATSWAGARGLMQIVPETAERFGDSTRMHEAEYNLMVGVRYLKWLQEFWKEIPEESQRIKFILASYNVGEGHVLDARRLAKKFGKDQAIWDNNVDSFLVKKAFPVYYRDEVVYNGYCRGSEPYKYVREILTMYDHYTKLVEAS